MMANLLRSSKPLKLLVVAGVLLTLLTLVPDAGAQGASTPGGQCTNIGGTTYCIDKTASPAQASIGQPITFTITVGPTNCLFQICAFEDTITDTLPAGVAFVSATATNTFTLFGQPTCTNAGNTVTCTNIFSAFTFPPPQALPSTITIVATPKQCGTFTNTATSTRGISASADFTVVGCPTQQQRQPHQQQPACPPASQELANEAESGNVSPSFDVADSGNSSNQTAAPNQFGNTGNDNNAQGVLQTCGSQSGNAELEGGDMNFSPTLDTSTNQGVGQSSGSSGQ